MNSALNAFLLQTLLTSNIFLSKNVFCGNSNVGVGVALTNDHQPPVKLGTKLKNRKKFLPAGSTTNVGLGVVLDDRQSDSLRVTNLKSGRKLPTTATVGLLITQKRVAKPLTMKNNLEEGLNTEQRNTNQRKDQSSSTASSSRSEQTLKIEERLSPDQKHDQLNKNDRKTSTTSKKDETKLKIKPTFEQNQDQNATRSSSKTKQKNGNEKPINDQRPNRNLEQTTSIASNSDQAKSKKQINLANRQGSGQISQNATAASKSDQIKDKGKKPISEQIKSSNEKKSEKHNTTEQEMNVNRKQKQKKFIRTTSFASPSTRQISKKTKNFQKNENNYVQKQITSAKKRRYENLKMEMENGRNGRSPKRLKMENLNEKTDGQQSQKIKQKVNRTRKVSMEQMIERKKRMRKRKKEMEEKKKKEQQKQSQSSEEQINLLPPSATNLPFGELEEDETYTYEQHKASHNFNRSISLGAVPEIRFLKIKNLCDMSIGMKAAGEASKEKSIKAQSLLAVAAQIGLRNAFCHFYFYGLTLPSAFDIKFDDKNNNNKNKKLETISELDESFETGKNDNEEEKAKKRIRHFHNMLIDSRVEEIVGSDMGTFKLRFCAPYMFTALRAVFDHPPVITSEDLIRSIAEKPLKLMPNPAQSGASFLRTNDAQFFIKSADQNEIKFFHTFTDRIGKQKEQINFFVGGIWDYYEYFRDQLINGKRTLLPKYFALFDLKHSKSKEHQNFIMINSVFPQNFPKIHYKFDLKGASINRKELKFGTSDEAQHKTCRDLDFFRFNSEDKNGTMAEGLFRHGICIGREKHEELAQLLEDDTWFLKAHNIMDYSLLMAVHFVGKQKLPDEWLDELPFGVFHGKCNNCKNPFRNVYENDQKLLISIGIIDTLQTYDYPRELEDIYKSSMSIFRKKDGFLFPPETRQKYKPNSVKHPSVYRNRFLEAILTVFLRPNCISSPENDEIIHEKREYKAESQSKEFIFKAMAEKSDQTNAQQKLISPSRKQLERRKQQEKILEDLRKLDLQIPLKFRKNKSKNENFEKKTTINRAVSLPINFRDEMPKRTKKKPNNEKKISKN